MKLRNNDVKTKNCHPYLFTHVDMDPLQDGTLFQYPTGLGEYSRAVAEGLLAYLRFIEGTTKWDHLFSKRQREEADLAPWDPKNKKNYTRKESDLELLLSGPKSEATKGLEKDISEEMEAILERRNRLTVETLMAGYHIPSQNDTNSLDTKTMENASTDDKTMASMTTIGTNQTTKSVSRTAVEAMMSLNLLTEDQKSQLRKEGVDMTQFELKLPSSERTIESSSQQGDAISVWSDIEDIDEASNRQNDETQKQYEEEDEEQGSVLSDHHHQGGSIATLSQESRVSNDEDDKKDDLPSDTVIAMAKVDRKRASNISELSLMKNDLSPSTEHGKGRNSTEEAKHIDDTLMVQTNQVDLHEEEDSPLDEKAKVDRKRASNISDFSLMKNDLSLSTEQWKGMNSTEEAKHIDVPLMVQTNQVDLQEEDDFSLDEEVKVDQKRASNISDFSLNETTDAAPAKVDGT